MSAHVVMNLLNELRKRKCETCRAFISFATSLINSIILGAQMLDSIYHMTLKLLKNHILGVKTSRFCHLLRNVIMDVITLPNNL